MIKIRIITPGNVQKALTFNRIELELQELSRKQLNALIKVQDPNFYHQKGYDISNPAAGVTTIGQGLIKMYFFENFKPGLQ